MNKTINISISKRLLEDIEANIAGDSRSEKIVKCAELGYKLLMENL